MKKVLLVMVALLLVGCAPEREEFYELTIDDYSISVGYDNSEYMSNVYEYDIKNELQEGEVIKDVNIYLYNNLLGVGEFSNTKTKPINCNDAVLTKLTIYLNDLPGRTFRINGEPLDKSIKTNCNKYNGTYINKNGYACVIENNFDEVLNVIELHGDYLNIDQDEVDHITIYVE